MDILTTLFTLLTSGAGGGLLGGIFGLFRKSQEVKERIELEKIQMQREEYQRQDRASQRDHEVKILEMGGDIDLKQSINEWQGRIEVANQAALSKAQDSLNNLNTTSGMDNYRASVRPTQAYWITVMFTVMIGWAFSKWHGLITDEAGYEIMMGMFSTLSFAFTSVIMFYFVNRNNQPRGNNR